mmetsp:Transcript_60474/g.72695  ORF Transcript_60474/g.72695 Transcript_60474/m.72695 type:complete len:809 (+) Transcript_60474:661-3087(+)
MPLRNAGSKSSRRGGDSNSSTAGRKAPTSSSTSSRSKSTTTTATTTNRRDTPDPALYDNIEYDDDTATNTANNDHEDDEEDEEDNDEDADTFDEGTNLDSFLSSPTQNNLHQTPQPGTDFSAEIKMSYLIRYEQMIRQQDAEEMSTVSHLRPLFDRLVVLGRKLGESDSGANDATSKANQSSSNNDASVTYSVLREDGERIRVKDESVDVLTFEGMQRALDYIETLSSHEDDMDDDEDGDDDGSAPRGAGGTTTSAATNTSSSNSEYDELMATDNQLMMVLRELVNAFEQEPMLSHTPTLQNSSPTVSIVESDVVEVETTTESYITFPEFLHCYKTVINGMMALQMLPVPPSSGNSITDGGSTIGAGMASPTSDEASRLGLDEDELSQNTTTTILAAGRESAVRTVRKRTTDRIMSMIHTFDKGWKYVSAEKKAKQEDKIRREAFEEASRVSQIDESNMMSTDDMRKLLLAKDNQIVNLMESHASEIEELGNRISWINSSRKRQTFIGAVIIVFICFGGALFIARSPPPPLPSSTNGVSVPPMVDTVGDDVEKISGGTVSNRGVEKIKKHLASSIEEVVALKKENSDISKEIQTIETRDKELKKQLSRIEVDSDKLRAKYERLEEHEKLLYNEIGELKKENTDARGDVALCRATAQISSSKEANKEKDVSGLTAQEIKLNEMMLKTAESALEHCQAHLRYVESDLESLYSYKSTTSIELKRCERELTVARDQYREVSPSPTAASSDFARVAGEDESVSEIRMRKNKRRREIIFAVMGGAAIAVAPSFFPSLLRVFPFLSKIKFLAAVK